MTQSPLAAQHAAQLHVAIIMDGNGRWATARGLPRSAGHRQGARAVRPIVEKAPDLGIGTLTLYAFSSDNWRRPQREVSALMRLFLVYLRAETERCIKQGVRVSVIGRREGLSPQLCAAIGDTEAATAQGRTLHLRLAVNYSARDAIVRAARLLDASSDCSCEDFARLLTNDGSPAPDVDLLIRSGGEQRLSDFLLWECAYAELYFTPRMWPEITPADLETAVREFRSRERRFGRVPAPAHQAGAPSSPAHLTLPGGITQALPTAQ
jgi:undecaprenyl diphosphate synthase